MSVLDRQNVAPRDDRWLYQPQRSTWAGAISALTTIGWVLLFGLAWWACEAAL